MSASDNACKAAESQTEAEEREIVNGMVEEWTSSASSWPGLIDDIIAYGDGCRQQAIEECAQRIEAEGRRSANNWDAIMARKGAAIVRAMLSVCSASESQEKA